MHIYPDEKQNTDRKNAFTEEKRCIIACKVLWREISYLTARSPKVFDVFFLEQGLHDEPQKLQSILQSTITKLEKEYPLILIGYGLCSNGIEGISSSTSKLVFIRAHDCITMFLGSKEKYRRMFDKHPGTYWYGTGWMETSALPDGLFYDKKFEEYKERYDEDTAEYLIQSEQEWIKKYHQITFIHQEIIDEKNYIEAAKKSAQLFQWNFKHCKGDLKLLEDWIAGRWYSKRFLILEPGESLSPSFREESIITKRQKSEGIDNPSDSVYNKTNNRNGGII
jgi:hypothetical protein